jgi:hypothetical protein
LFFIAVLPGVNGCCALVTLTALSSSVPPNMRVWRDACRLTDFCPSFAPLLLIIIRRILSIIINDPIVSVLTLQILPFLLDVLVLLRFKVVVKQPVQLPRRLRFRRDGTGELGRHGVHPAVERPVEGGKCEEVGFGGPGQSGEPSGTVWREMTVRVSVDHTKTVELEDEARYFPLGENASSPTACNGQRTVTDSSGISERLTTRSLAPGSSGMMETHRLVAILRERCLLAPAFPADDTDV